MEAAAKKPSDGHVRIKISRKLNNQGTTLLWILALPVWLVMPDSPRPASSDAVAFGKCGCHVTDT